MNNLDNFQKKIPTIVLELCREISKRGFLLTLVGGAVRDYLINGKISSDLDFEIKHTLKIDEASWEQELISLFEKLEREFQVVCVNKGHHVFSLALGGHELEFSSPRVEHFTKGSLSHKNFTSQFISNLGHEEAFIRRDFSFNAVGICFALTSESESFKLIDPYGGESAILKKELIHISKDFFLDPVRFLRMIRFKNLLNFKINETLLLDLSKFNLREISNYYIFSEFKKLGSMIFFTDLYELSQQHKIELSPKLQELSFLKDLSQNSFLRFESNTFEAWIFLHRDVSATHKKLLCDYCGFSQKKFKFSLMLFGELLSFENDASTLSFQLLDKLIKFEHRHLLSNVLIKFICCYEKSVKSLEYKDVDNLRSSKSSISSALVGKFFAK